MERSSPGAQTERRGDAGPMSVSRQGGALIGRFFDRADHGLSSRGRPESMVFAGLDTSRRRTGSRPGTLRLPLLLLRRSAVAHSVARAAGPFPPWPAAPQASRPPGTAVFLATPERAGRR